MKIIKSKLKPVIKVENEGNFFYHVEHEACESLTVNMISWMQFALQYKPKQLSKLKNFNHWWEITEYIYFIDENNIINQDYDKKYYKIAEEKTQRFYIKPENIQYVKDKLLEYGIDFIYIEDYTEKSFEQFIKFSSIYDYNDIIAIDCFDYDNTKESMIICHCKKETISGIPFILENISK